MNYFQKPQTKDIFYCIVQCVLCIQLYCTWSRWRMSMLEYFDGAQHGRRMDGRPEESRDDCRWRRDWNFSRQKMSKMLKGKKNRLNGRNLEQGVVVERVISGRATAPAVGGVKLLRLEDEGETLKFPEKGFSFSTRVWELFCQKPDVHFHRSGAALACALSFCFSLLSWGQC